uniref:Secreted protein n=1 Tax=Ditylenchus dipsaci TaxID=166011 RepID=A0A915DN46_9BILA
MNSLFALRALSLLAVLVVGLDCFMTYNFHKPINFESSVQATVQLCLSIGDRLEMITLCSKVLLNGHPDHFVVCQEHNKKMLT